MNDLRHQQVCVGFTRRFGPAGPISQRAEIFFQHRKQFIVIEGGPNGVANFLHAGLQLGRQIGIAASRCPR